MRERFIWGNNQFLHLLFFFFYFFCYCSSLPSASTSPNTTHLCPPSQRFALLQFKTTTKIGSEPHYRCADSSPPKTASWSEKLGGDCCSWDGVTCDKYTGNVIGLDLECSWLRGTILDNSSLFQLSHLQWLNLACNNFIGSTISSEFGQLQELTNLNLSASSFHGVVPSQISHLSKLTSLDLDNYDSDSLTSLDQQTFQLLALNLTRLSVLNLRCMNLSSVNPTSLLNLSSSITVLRLGGTGIQGTFPDKIFLLSNLQEIYLNSNEDLTGYLPKSNWSSPLRVLDLSLTNFNGGIPDSIGNLKFMEFLNIAYCNFTGSISPTIGNLTRVTYLDLRQNHFNGQLPLSLSKLDKVVYIYLSRNMLSGQIPDINLDLELLHLTALDLSYNFLTGSIPSWLFTISSLQVTDLSYNKLTGTIPQFKLPNSAREVHLSHNEIQGQIPSAIFELVNLTTLDISSNNLSGIIKFDELSKLQNLETLDLSNNSLLSFSSTSNDQHSMPNLTSLIFSYCNISGFPSFLRSSEKLYLLDLSNNRIHGRISESKSEGWKSLTNLDLSHNSLIYVEHPWKNIKRLRLENNMIQGSILVPPPTTEFFLGSNNKLTGQIPASICNLTSLRCLRLSNNSLSGKIPSCIGNLSNGLIMLHLQKNNLEGSIPDTFVYGSSLMSLDLSENKLEGKLPISLVNSTQLEVINVGNNKLIDTFPCWVGTLPGLRILALRSNGFHGRICTDSGTISRFLELRIIDLSHNKFSGFLLRRFFESMEAMKNVTKDEFKRIDYLGGNYYLDSLQVTTKGMDVFLDRVPTIFTSIDLSRNQFQGELPEILGEFKSLKVLNFSHNNLTGNIPSSLGNSKELESLDLSSNKFVGEIPKELEYLAFLSALNLSYNKLSGRIPQGGQFSTFGNDSFVGNLNLCGMQLRVNCSNDIDGAPPPQEDSESTEFDFKWKSIVMMGYGGGIVIGLSLGYIIFSTGKPQWFVRIIEEFQHKMIRRRSHQRRGRKKNYPYW